MKNVFKFKMFWIYDVTISFNDELNFRVKIYKRDRHFYTMFRRF